MGSCTGTLSEQRSHQTNRDNKMKVALLLAFVGLQDVSAVTPFEAIIEEWETWKLQYGKTYPRNYGDSLGGGYSQEESFRMKIWMENKAKIEKHNRHFYKGVHTYNLRMNEFGDLLHHEFVATLNGYRQVNSSVGRPQGAKYLMPAHTTKLPENVDWREKGAVTAVKNQGQCGSCWSFSTTGALEAMHHRATGKLVSLSEQNIMENGGIDTEKSYPYEGEDDKCRYNPAYRGATDIGFVDVEAGNEAALKSAIATQGPCSVAIDASHESFQ